VRRNYLFSYFQEKWDEYAEDLLLEDSRESQALYRKFQNAYEGRDDLTKKLLSLYLDRCNFWHAFAFFQYRS
jgi:hypothetical protein